MKESPQVRGTSLQRHCLFPRDVRPEPSLEVFRQISPFIRESKGVQNVFSSNLEHFSFHSAVLPDLVVLQKSYMRQVFC